MKRLLTLSNLLAGALAVTLLAPKPARAQLFSDNFDVNSSGTYTVNQDPDTTVAFAYDYSVDGIPSAPGSPGGSTLGVKFTANKGDATGAAAAINISPTGQSFAGDYVLRFHSWLNTNGPFPLGGTGSTEFVTGGVGNSGTTVQKAVAGSSNGPWFAGSSEGEAAGDFRAVQTVTVQADASTVYAAPNPSVPPNIRRESANTYYHTAIPGATTAPASQIAAFPVGQAGTTNPGTLAFAWHLHEIRKVGTAVSWTINGLPIATFPTPTLGGSNIFVGHWDAFASIADNVAVNFGIIDNLVVEAIVPPPVDDADFDGDGDVDGADFLTWQRGLGSVGDKADGNANGPSGTIDGGDLAIWRTQFGSAVPVASAVPEPATWALAALAGLVCFTATWPRRQAVLCG